MTGGVRAPVPIEKIYAHQTGTTTTFYDMTDETSLGTWTTSGFNVMSMTFVGDCLLVLCSNRTVKYLVNGTT